MTFAALSSAAIALICSTKSGLPSAAAAMRSLTSVSGARPEVVSNDSVASVFESGAR